MPHLRALVERHKDDPFELIGVSVKDTDTEIRKGIEDFSVTWKIAHQTPGTSPISNLYQVRAYPTYFLIGPTGKILASGHDGEALDKMIDAQIQALKEKPADESDPEKRDPEKGDAKKGDTKKDDTKKDDARKG
ncbi:MAG: TlpA family protein disulfide reductase [Planctomycetes bacterium]|nr:TlpA family protein disulfide reductase [Planctomycetota bacterium]MCB9910914.1 TlpA family protein disulfide reductase [Planctomycetota bacterium]MCB9912125.1 TlpA family protein disulfide reductase [Planctomycetota bacterium]